VMLSLVREIKVRHASTPGSNTFDPDRLTFVTGTKPSRSSYTAFIGGGCKAHYPLGEHVTVGLAPSA
jgi:hypothetical protein